jgi:hypothetical protein
MPDSRGLYFVINERQKRWWLYADDKPLYRSTDAEPLPTEPQRERSTYPRRLAFRLRSIVRPGRRIQGAAL